MMASRLGRNIFFMLLFSFMACLKMVPTVRFELTSRCLEGSSSVR